MKKMQPMDLLTYVIAIVWLLIFVRYIITGDINKDIFSAVTGVLGSTIGFQAAKTKKKDSDDEPDEHTAHPPKVEDQHEPAPPSPPPLPQTPPLPSPPPAPLTTDKEKQRDPETAPPGADTP